MKKILPLPNRDVLAYFAGIFDGEGSVYVIYRDKPSLNPNGQRRETVFSYIKVANNNINLMRWLVENIGGAFGYVVKSGGPHGKAQYQWRLCGSQAQPLLEAIIPLLIVKREEAVLMLEMRALVREKTTGRNRPLPQADRDARREVYERYRELRRKIRTGEIHNR